MKRMPLILALLIGGIFVFNAVFLGIRVYQAVRLAGESQAFEVRSNDAGRRILVVGDNIGVGTGAGDPGLSIAGLIARDFPAVEIINRSRNGAGATEVLEQLLTAEEQAFDVILIHAGSIDILRLKSPDEIKEPLSRLLHQALAISGRVIVMGPGNIGLAPAFFPPISWMYTERARAARELFVLLARQTRVEYVDLFRERGDDPVRKDPGRFFASDRLHPGSEAYSLWYGELMRQSSLADILRRP